MFSGHFSPLMAARPTRHLLESDITMRILPSQVALPQEGVSISSERSWEDPTGENRRSIGVMVAAETPKPSRKRNNDTIPWLPVSFALRVRRRAGRLR